MAQPLVIEVAINGLVTKAQNPHVPITPDEMEASIEACISAGAAIVHAHAGDPYVGVVTRHASEPYVEAFGRVLARNPDALLYPTLPAGPHLAIAERYAHLAELDQAGILPICPIDPGTMNWGEFSADGSAGEEFVYQNTFGDVRYAFEFCRTRGLACTMSIFEPGFLQIVLAHARNGTMPQPSMVKFEFSGGRLVFGLPPGPESLDAYLAMVRGTDIPWFVNLRDGDMAERLGALAVSRGGHVRVGIEDYAGPRTPKNEELVAAMAEIGRQHGREPAGPVGAARLFGVRPAKRSEKSAA
jgi:uncharacterized protein (DUF849 family)